MKVSLSIDIDEGSAQPIRFDAKKGFMIGGVGNEMKFNADIICSNATTKAEKAVTLKMNLAATANITIRDLMLYPSISSVAINDVVKTYDTVPMYYHDYTQILSLLVRNAVTDVNLKYDKGMDMSSYLPTEVNYLKNITISPFVNDQWIYAGFDLNIDKFNAEKIEFV